MTGAGALILAMLTGGAIGSFACVLARRMARGQDWVREPSRCERCGCAIRWRDLLPILSWVLLRGRCRTCRAAIPWDHPALELLGAAVPLWAAMTVPEGAFWLSCGLGWGLLTLAAVDAASFRLPLLGTLPLLAGGLAAVQILAQAEFPAHAAAAAIAWVSFEAIAWAYRRLRGRDGLGGGDAWLLAAGGAWAGPAALPGIVFLAAIAAILWGCLATRRFEATLAVPFGPFLALAIWIAWLYGPLFVP